MSGAAAPHRRRRLGGETLLTGEAGGFAVVDAAGLRDYLAGGVEPGHRLWLKLQSAGLLRRYMDFDDLARGMARGGLMAWAGPPRHLIRLEGGARAMGLEALRRALDRAFDAAPPRVHIELAAPELGPAWAKVWFAVEYGQRRAEWSGRALSVCARLQRAPELAPEQAEFLRARGVALRLPVEAAGSPRRLDFPEGVHVRALCRVGAGAREPGGWASALADAGASSVRLEPERLSAAAVARFGRFYGGFLDALLSHGAPKVREEWTEGALSRILRPASGSWEDEETDLLGSVGHDPDGAASAQPNVPDLLAAECADRQPLCSQCAYAPYCRPSPSAHLRDQGTLWGQTPSSGQCALALARWDALFERLRQEPLREILASWLDSPAGGFY